jgi:cell division septation protein DedD
MLSILSEETAAPAGYRAPRRELAQEAFTSSTHDRASHEDQASNDDRAMTPSADSESTLEEGEEFEIVMGRRQIASVLFVATVVLAVFSSVAYLAGKSMAPKIITETPTSIAPAIATTPVEPQIPMINATIVPLLPPVTTKPATGAGPEAPIFAEPVTGAVYIQMAAVEKGIAAIFAEGLRRHGLQSFVAPGPNETLNRVLIGPLPTPAAFTRAKEELDKIGLITFARRYEK